MKTGDIVRCKYPFRFESVHDEHLLTISIQTQKGDAQIKDYLTVPLYLSGIGFHLPDFDYCLPGSYLPITHPDYYRETKSGYFTFYGEQCKISFDDDFAYTGKYWLLPETGAPIAKTAQLRSADLRQKRIDDAIGNVLDGIMIEGVILDFLIAEKETGQILSVINGKEYVPGHQIGDTKVLVFMQDPVTRVEFNFPAIYLTLKP